MISGGSLERGARVEEERKVDGVTRRKGRRGRREERGRGKGRRERGPSYWGTGKGGCIRLLPGNALGFGWAPGKPGKA